VVALTFSIRRRNRLRSFGAYLPTDSRRPSGARHVDHIGRDVEDRPRERPSPHGRRSSPTGIVRHVIVDFDERRDDDDTRRSPRASLAPREGARPSRATTSENETALDTAVKRGEPWPPRPSHLLSWGVVRGNQ